MDGFGFVLDFLKVLTVDIAELKVVGNLGEVHQNHLLLSPQVLAVAALVLFYNVRLPFLALFGEVDLRGNVFGDRVKLDPRVFQLNVVDVQEEELVICV